MNGRTHRFIAFVIVTMALALLTFANIRNGLNIGIISGVMAISIFCYSKANEINIKVAELEKQQPKKKEKDSPNPNIDKLTLLKKIYVKMEGFAWLVLFIAIFMTILTADFFPDYHRGVSIGIALITIPITTIAGSFYPDWDWDWGAKFHRNPLLHSYLIPFSIWIFGMVAFPYEFRALNVVSAMYCVAYATHLIADCVPSTTTGVINILKDFLNTKQTAGDVRQIPEHWEHKWLLSSGIILLICFGLTIPRLYGTWGFDWEGIDSEGKLSITYQLMMLMIIGGIGIGLFLIMYLKGYLLNRKKK